MKTRAVVAGGLLALAGVWAISAVGQSMLIEPAEYPPASYEGREYVDSNGCVFIRAGVDGAVNWVPRVTRDRKPVCGFEPTFTAQQLASLKADEQQMMASPAPVTSVPVVEPMPEPTPAPAIASPTVASTHPSVVNDIYVGSGTNMAASASTVTYAPSGSDASVGFSVPRNVPGQVVNDIYVGGSSAVAPTTTYTGSTTSTTTSYVQYSPSTTGSLAIGIPNTQGSVPAGYKPAWSDGRVNLQRGPQSSTGDAQMNRIWTQTIPRQLVADAGGVQRVRSGLGSVRSGVGNTFSRIVPWMSTKELAPGSAGSYIQIGAFGSAENVDKNIARLSAMGMNAAVQNAGSVSVVLAGPFASADVRSALNHLRSAGYSDAFVQ